jgi:hypothetical protein
MESVCRLTALGQFVNRRINKEVVMSKILWKQALRPLSGDAPECRVYDLYDDFDFRIPRTTTIRLRDEEIVELPDPKSFRALNRGGLLLAAVGLQSRSALAELLAEDPFSVGLYCAIQDGAEDSKTAKQMVHTVREDFARTYKSLRSSKQFLRQIGSIQPSFLSIFLGIMGPQYVFSHSRWGALHALEQAEFDLYAGVVRAGLVCSGFSLEDPLLSMRVRRSIPDSSVLCEGAAALVLTPNGEYTDWRCGSPADEKCFFGIAHDLVLLATKSEECEEDHGRSGVVHRGGESHLQDVTG